MNWIRYEARSNHRPSQPERRARKDNHCHASRRHLSPAELQGSCGRRRPSRYCYPLGFVCTDDAEFPAGIARLGGGDVKLHREVKKFLTDYDFIVIDCPPSADSPVSQSALLIADLCLVPIIPSPPDLWAGVAIRKVIEAASSVNRQLQARLLINQRKPNTRLATKTLELLPEYLIPLCVTQIGDREAYRHAAAYGKTVHDLGPKAAAAVREVEALTSEILSVMQLGGSVDEQRPVGQSRPVAAG